VVYVGSSNFGGWDLAAAQETAKARHFFGLASEQSVYNLMERAVELEVLPSARHYGIGLLPWSPLAGGLLAGAAAKATAGRRGDDNAMLGHSARERESPATSPGCRPMRPPPLTWTSPRPSWRWPGFSLGPELPPRCSALAPLSS
jgi:aryl-alcohol dehydrogenase-like predicted oxidoreductase